jgi:nucleoside-diphosphate-sugar epimerase
VGLYPWSKGAAEQVVREQNGRGLETVIVRPRLVWGKGDTTLLPRVAALVQAGRFGWIDDGRARTSSCHVRNLCAALLLVAERGVPGETYFVTDGEVHSQRDLWTRLLATQGVSVDRVRSMPHGLAAGIAWALEGAWKLLPLKGAPPLTRTAVKLIGETVTLSDAKIRRELGYRPQVTFEAGLAELAATAPPG